MIYVLVFLVILLAISVYTNYNLYRKYSILEDISLENERVAEQTQEFLNQIRTRVMSQRSYLKQLDRRGAFESDDEVGFFFKELKQIVQDISKNFEFGEEESEQNQDEEQQATNPFITSRF